MVSDAMIQYVEQLGKSMVELRDTLAVLMQEEGAFDVPIIKVMHTATFAPLYSVTGNLESAWTPKQVFEAVQNGIMLRFPIHCFEEENHEIKSKVRKVYLKGYMAIPHEIFEQERNMRTELVKLMVRQIMQPKNKQTREMTEEDEQ